MRTLLLTLLLTACSLPTDAVELPSQDWGEPCNPVRLSSCAELAATLGGWCSGQVNSVHSQCVIPCGQTCEQWGGLCSTEGECWRKP